MRRQRGHRNWRCGRRRGTCFRNRILATRSIWRRRLRRFDAFTSSRCSQSLDPRSFHHRLWWRCFMTHRAISARTRKWRTISWRSTRRVRGLARRRESGRDSSSLSRVRSRKLSSTRSKWITVIRVSSNWFGIASRRSMNGGTAALPAPISWAEGATPFSSASSCLILKRRSKIAGVSAIRRGRALTPNLKYLRACPKWLTCRTSKITLSIQVNFSTRGRKRRYRHTLNTREAWIFESNRRIQSRWTKLAKATPSAFIIAVRPRRRPGSTRGGLGIIIRATIINKMSWNSERFRLHPIIPETWLTRDKSSNLAVRITLALQLLIIWDMHRRTIEARLRT